MKRNRWWTHSTKNKWIITQNWLLLINQKFIKANLVVLMNHSKPACVGSVIWLFHAFSAFYVHKHLRNSQNEVQSYLATIANSKTLSETISLINSYKERDCLWLGGRTYFQGKKIFCVKISIHRVVLILYENEGGKSELPFF